jgi:subtilisin family serine protease
MRKFLPTLGAAVALALPGAAPALAAPPGSDDPGRAAAAQVLVGWKDGTSSADRDRAVRAAGAQGRERVVADVDVVKLAPGASNARAIDRLNADAAVSYAEPNWRVEHHATSSDTYFTSGQLWGMGAGFGSAASTAWAADHTGSSDVYVGIIDEGFQWSHPELAANTWTNTGEVTGNGVDDDNDGYVDDVHGFDFANNDGSTYDGGTRGNVDDHGTHVAGTIGAASNSAGVVGVNWNVKLISAKFLGKTGGTTANAIKATDYLTMLKRTKGLNIVASNNSWGGGGFSQGLYDAIERAKAQNILFIAAAGNGDKRGNGINNDTSAHYPSSYANTNVIAVAAIDSAGNKAPWSNYGATTVDLGAPGVGIWSTTAFNSYDIYSGTSMATPHVTGGAALYASTHPGSNAAAIKQGILDAATATPTASMAGRTVTGGRLNVGGF